MIEITEEGYVNSQFHRMFVEKWPQVNASTKHIVVEFGREVRVTRKVSPRSCELIPSYYAIRPGVIAFFKRLFGCLINNFNVIAEGLYEQYYIPVEEITIPLEVAWFSNDTSHHRISAAYDPTDDILYTTAYRQENKV